MKRSFKKNSELRARAAEDLNIGVGVLGRMAIGQWPQDKKVGMEAVHVALRALNLLLPKKETAFMREGYEYSEHERKGLTFFEQRLTKPTKQLVSL